VRSDSSTKSNKERAKAFAKTVTHLVYEEQERNGYLKQSYISSKFWGLMQVEIRKLEDAKND